MPDKKLDLVKLAKSIAKVTNVPLPKVASIMQKHPVTKDGMAKAFEECEKLGRAELEKQLKVLFPF
ncbi:MAG: hypothetical protein ABI832_18890 [bacterium]